MPKYDNILSKSSEASWSSHHEKIIKEPYTYTVSVPGKDFRRKLINAFNCWLNVPSEKLEHIIDVVNKLHNASLLIDDIQDNSLLRRGQPVAHEIYGVRQTINSAQYVCAQVMGQLSELRRMNSPDTLDVCDIVKEELIYLHRGQGLDIYWRDSFICPSEEEYVSMVNNKTGGLLRIGIRLMMACATTNTDANYVPLVNLVGVYFQIRDDLMNLDSTEASYAQSKGFAEDLSEGKFSFPIVHGIQVDPSSTYLMDILRQRPEALQPKIETVEYLRNKTKSFAYTQSVLDALEARIFDEIGRLGGNISLDVVMNLLRVKGQKTESPKTNRTDLSLYAATEGQKAAVSTPSNRPARKASPSPSSLLLPLLPPSSTSALSPFSLRTRLGGLWSSALGSRIDARTLRRLWRSVSLVLTGYRYTLHRSFRRVITTNRNFVAVKMLDPDPRRPYILCIGALLSLFVVSLLYIGLTASMKMPKGSMPIDSLAGLQAAF